jgi:Ca2+-binding EF-hand superfamily protein
LQAADENKDGFLEKHEFQRLLANIGAQDKLSSEELDEIVFEAMGDDPPKNSKIPMDRIKSILMGQFAKKR